MDPNKAPSVPSHSFEDRSSNVKLRRLWQVPVFFLGVAAVVAVCLMRGYVASDPVHQLHHELAEARQLLERDSSDPDGALRHAQQAVDNLTYDQGRAAEAFFLLGSAHLRIAEQAGAPATSEHW